MSSRGDTQVIAQQVRGRGSSWAPSPGIGAGPLRAPCVARRGDETARSWLGNH